MHQLASVSYSVVGVNAGQGDVPKDIDLQPVVRRLKLLVSKQKHLEMRYDLRLLFPAYPCLRRDTELQRAQGSPRKEVSAVCSISRQSVSTVEGERRLTSSCPAKFRGPSLPERWAWPGGSQTYACPDGPHSSTRSATAPRPLPRAPSTGSPKSPRTIASS